ncbi:hypothetical protein IJG28_00965 [Candidatus Saccharibacteria bacterium]|nr:hypothetical protein [Candidatus Saccharibacteria bacterium]
MIDIHSHILPGVDDGARDFEDSISCVSWLARQGFTDIVATPHYIVDTDYVSRREVNAKLVRELQEKLSAKKIGVRIWLGNEIYIDTKILELVGDGKISTLGQGKHLLVELPINGEFENYADYLGEMMDSGHKVVLAHPERYGIFQEDYQKVVEMYNMGILLQCNFRSILGKYGKEAEKLVRRVARDKLIYVLASDTHRAGRADYVTEAIKKFSRYYNPREISQLTTVNPGKIVVSQE